MRAACVQVAKKYAGDMPIQGSLQSVAAASRLAIGPLAAEVCELRTSLDQLQRMLTSLPDHPQDSFKQVTMLSSATSACSAYVFAWTASRKCLPNINHHDCP
jgi:hypothetical protein